MNATKWNSMSSAERTRALKRDASLRLPHWAALVATIAGKQYEELSKLQQEMVLTLK